MSDMANDFWPPGCVWWEGIETAGRDVAVAAGGPVRSAKFGWLVHN